MLMYKYNSIEDLYEFWDSFFSNIYSAHCENCLYPDCEGYIFLTNDEKERLYENYIPLLTLNDNVTIINSLKYIPSESVFDIEEIKPKCRLEKCGKCSIYHIRPLVCRIYPFSFYFENNKTYFVIHEDCKYTTDYFISNQNEIIKTIKKMFSSTNPNLINQVVMSYKNLNDVSMFPNEEKNKVLKIMEINYECNN